MCDRDVKSELEHASVSLQRRIIEMEQRRQQTADPHEIGRGRSRSPHVDPTRDCSPPRWLQQAADDEPDGCEAVGSGTAGVLAAPGGMGSGGAAGMGGMEMMGMMGGGMGMMGGMPGMGMMPMGMPMGMGMGMGGMPGGMPGMPGGMPGMMPMGGMGGIGGLPGMMPMGMMGMGGMGAMAAMGAAAQGQMQAMMAGAAQQQQQQQQQQEQRMAKAMAVIKAGAAPAAVEEGASASAGSGLPRTDPNSLAYRPNNTEPIPGITDRRWEGYIRLFIEDDLHGYGFIKCGDLRKRFPDKDVFLHRNQRAGFKQGDNVTFSVFMNFRGMPQATDLKRAKGRGGEGED